MTKKITTEQLVEKIVELIDDKKAENIITLNISKRSSLADFFIICDGTSERHVNALADEVTEKLKQKKIRPLRTDGLESKEWVVVDYGSVILHIFKPETRQLFKLEELWSKPRQTRKQQD